MRQTNVCSLKLFRFRSTVLVNQERKDPWFTTCGHSPLANKSGTSSQTLSPTPFHSTIGMAARWVAA